MTPIKVKHSNDKYLFFRTMKTKADYTQMHLKATTITPTGKHNTYQIKTN